jgi:hypothetical protein
MVGTNEVSAAEMLAAVVSGSGEHLSVMAVKPISFRIRLNALVRVDALAHKANKSRNAMLNMLVDVGLEEVLARLSKETFEEVQSRESHAFQSLLNDNQLESFSE